MACLAKLGQNINALAKTNISLLKLYKSKTWGRFNILERANEPTLAGLKMAYIASHWNQNQRNV